MIEPSKAQASCGMNFSKGDEPKALAHRHATTLRRDSLPGRQWTNRDVAPINVAASASAAGMSTICKPGAGAAQRPCRRFNARGEKICAPCPGGRADAPFAVRRTRTGRAKNTTVSTPAMPSERSASASLANASHEATHNPGERGEHRPVNGDGQLGARNGAVIRAGACSARSRALSDRPSAECLRC